MKKILTLAVVLGGLNVCQAQYTATATSDQEVTPNTTTSDDGTYGFGNFTLVGTTLTVSGGQYGNLDGDPTVITINDAPPGNNAAGPLFALTIDPDQADVGGGFVDGTFSGSGTLTAGEITDLNNGDLYLNIASSPYPAGEVRGQLISSVPEPATMTLMGVGSLVLAAIRRKKA